MCQPIREEITGIHRLPFLGAFGVAALALAMVTLSVLAGNGPADRAAEVPTVDRSITFRTNSAGGFSVLDSQTHEQLKTFDMGEGAFVRSAIRAMSLKRKYKRIAHDLPYQLAQSQSGQLTLNDPETGHTISLNAFGQVAKRSFEGLLVNVSGTES